MAHKRFKDVEWSSSYDEKTGAINSTESAILQAVCDVRDELKKLNALLHCSNFVGIPRTLKTIDKRLAKKVPLR